MSTIPLTRFDGYLKQIRTSTWDQRSRSLFAYLFPAFTDERDYVSVGRQTAELASAFSPLIEVRTDVQQPRRFAGPYLPRARYFSVCRDGHGHDHDTLAHELRSYRDAARSGVVEVVDLGVRPLRLGVGDKEYDFDIRPEIGVFVHFPDRIPDEFATLVAQKFDDGHPVWMFRFPYSVTRANIEDVVDLRLPATQARFHEHFSRPRPNEGIMWPEPDTDTGSRRRLTTAPSTIAVSRFRSYGK